MDINNYLPLIIDGIILLIFIISVVDGYKRGFVRIILSVAALIICITAANAASEPVAKAVNEAFVRDAAVEYLTETVSNSAQESAENIIEQIPGVIADIAEENGISLSSLAEKATDKEALRPECERFIIQIEDVTLLPVLKLLCFAAVYFILQAICAVIIKLINKVFNLPIISGLNRSLGAICGGAKGAVMIAVICLVIVSLQPLFASIPFGQAVEETALMNGIYEITSDILNK